RVAIVTNQSGIARALYGWAGFVAVQATIDAALARAGTAVDAVLACAYHGEGKGAYAIPDHPWRKPRPGMIIEGLNRLNGVAAHSAMVGDKASDIAAAHAACLGRAVLIDRGVSGAGPALEANAVVRSLGEAVKTLSQGAAAHRMP